MDETPETRLELPLELEDDGTAAIAADLTIEAAYVDGSRSVGSVAEMAFGEAVAVVSNGVVVGLVTRALLAEKLFARFGYALYGERPIEVLAMTDALRVSASTPLDFVLVGALARPMHRAYDDILVVDDFGRYVGLLAVKRLILHQMRLLVRSRANERRAEERAGELAEHAELTSRFLATITHELRAPVNTMIGLAELVHAQIAAGRTDRAANHVASMRKTAALLRGLVDDVLDQAKLDAKMADSSEETFDLVALADDVATATRPLVLGKPVDVRISSSFPSRLVRSDRLKVRQILTNFASNAAKHTDEGLIEFLVAESDERIAVSVRDSGPGIPDEARDLLFRPFVQIDDPSTRRHGGTGLGLANAKRFADLIDATITVASKLGRGTVFTLELPARASAREESS